MFSRVLQIAKALTNQRIKKALRSSLAQGFLNFVFEVSMIANILSIYGLTMLAYGSGRGPVRSFGLQVCGVKRLLFIQLISSRTLSGRAPGRCSSLIALPQPRLGFFQPTRPYPSA